MDHRPTPKLCVPPSLKANEQLFHCATPVNRNRIRCQHFGWIIQQYSIWHLPAKYLELDAMSVVLVEIFMNLLVPFVPTRIPESACGTSAQKKIGLSQIQIKLSIASLLVQVFAWYCAWVLRIYQIRILWCFFNMLTSISIVSAQENQRNLAYNGRANLFL